MFLQLFREFFNLKNKISHQKFSYNTPYIPYYNILFYKEPTSCSIEAINSFSTFSSSMDDVTERVGLGAEGLVGGACDDTNFCTAAGIMAEVIGTAEVVGAPLGMDSACTILLLGGGMLGGGIVVTIDMVVEGTALPTTFWEAVEIGVELDKGCLSRAGGVLAVVATDDSG